MNLGISSVEFVHLGAVLTKGRTLTPKNTGIPGKISPSREGSALGDGMATTKVRQENASCWLCFFFRQGKRYNYL